MVVWWASVLVLVGALIPGVASGAPPTFERIAVDETFADEFLTEECGFPCRHARGGTSSSARSRAVARGWSRCERSTWA